jgi:host factor-I protein
MGKRVGLLAIRVEALRPLMAAAHPHALQDTFLDHVRKHDVPVTVFLANGIRLQGTVAGFDSYVLLLVRDRQSQLIYKHAISTIVPSEPDRMAQVSDRQGASQDVRSRPA